MAHMVKSTFLMLVANFVHSPSSLRSGEAPALLDVSSIAGVDATSVVEVGAVVVPAAIYTSIWLWHGPSPRPWVIIIDFALDGTAPAREARRRRHRRARSPGERGAATTPSPRKKLLVDEHSSRAGGTVSDLRAYEKEELYNGRWTELYPFIDFNYTVGSNITFHCLDPVNLTGTVAVSVQYTSALRAADLSVPGSR